MGGVEQGEQDAAQGGVAAGGVVPLLQGVDAAAEAARADGDGGDAERERNIGVGRADARFGAQVEMAVDGAKGGEQRRIVGERASGPVADGLNRKGGVRRSGLRPEVRRRACDFGGVKLGRIGGAQVQPGGGGSRGWS